LDGQSAAVSYTDVTTGEFAVTELPLESLRAELTRLHPAEILHPDNQILPNEIIGHTHFPGHHGNSSRASATRLCSLNSNHPRWMALV
jgi:DNA mismatch repair ATPase MutS